jgi:hypothetical protein
MVCHFKQVEKKFAEKKKATLLINEILIINYTRERMFMDNKRMVVGES